MQPELDVDRFGPNNPELNPDLFVEHTRVALSKFHQSPAEVSLHIDREHFLGRIRFRNPDPRSNVSLQRPDFIECGAIVIAGLILNHFERKQLTRVVPRGTRVDYFVGEKPGDMRWILEVGGTDEQSLESIREKKTCQMRESCYRYPPYSKDGFVSVTRFARPSCAATLDRIAAE